MRGAPEGRREHYFASMRRIQSLEVTEPEVTPGERAYEGWPV